MMLPTQGTYREAGPTGPSKPLCFWQSFFQSCILTRHQQTDIHMGKRHQDGPEEEHLPHICLPGTAASKKGLPAKAGRAGGRCSDGDIPPTGLCLAPRRS